MPLKLLEKSGATLLKNTQVKFIGKDERNADTKNVIIYETENQEVFDNSFDYVCLFFYNSVLNVNFQ